MFEISDHLRPECIGECRIVTGVSTVDFTSRKLDENGKPTGKDLHMEFDRAKNWTFDGGELTSRLDNGDMLMSFHFIDSLEREQTVQAEKEPELAPVVDEIGSDNAEVDAPAPEATAPDKGENFTITDDALGEGGAKAKFRANVDAIKTLKTLEREKRSATAEEKETLSKYVGWGALAKAFDKNDEKWAAEYKELSELLTPQEYAQARSTVNDAFYTSPTVIDGIYEALANFGFEGGNVLEPARVRNFFGRMPKICSRTLSSTAWRSTRYPAELLRHSILMRILLFRALSRTVFRTAALMWLWAMFRSVSLVSVILSTIQRNCTISSLQKLSTS